mgnify:CR=1 FL=1
MKRKKYYYLDPVIIRIPGIKTLFAKSVGSEMRDKTKYVVMEKYIPLLSLMQR